MKRPLLLRLAPLAARVALYYRLYRARAADRPDLYTAASLAFAPAVRMRLQPGDEIHDCIAYTGLYEVALTRHIMQRARTGGLLVDVGANFGYFSLLWAATGPANRAVAFEASPRNIPGLRHNVMSNGFSARICVEACAASRTAGVLAFDPGPMGQTGWGGAANGKTSNTVNVPAVRLDVILASEACIDVLKIDVEGAEPWVLEGAERLLSEQRVRQIFFETNKPRLAALDLPPDASEKLLQAAGYAVSPLGDPDAEVVEFGAAPRGT